MKKYLQNNRLQLLFTLIGAAGGFFYWKFVGCLDGTCPIRSVWYWSTLWGGSVGYLAGDFIHDFILKKKKNKDTNSEREISKYN